MPRIISLQPDATALVDLGHGSGSLEIGASMWKKTPCFTLFWYYAPLVPLVFRPEGGQPMPLADFCRRTLARATITVSGKLDEMDKVAATALDGGSLVEDGKRLIEAFQLFRYGSQVSKDSVEEAVTKAQRVLAAYWGIREWMGAGMKERVEIEVGPTKLICEV